jgi:hypothetical protein
VVSPNTRVDTGAKSVPTPPFYVALSGRAMWHGPRYRANARWPRARGMIRFDVIFVVVVVVFFVVVVSRVTLTCKYSRGKHSMFGTSVRLLRSPFRYFCILLSF